MAIVVLPYQQITLGHPAGTLLAPQSWTPRNQDALDVRPINEAIFRLRIVTDNKPFSGSGNNKFTFSLLQSIDKMNFPPIGAAALTFVFDAASDTDVEEVFELSLRGINYIKAQFVSTDFEGVLNVRLSMSPTLV